MWSTTVYKVDIIMNLTENAITKLQEIIREENNPKIKLRVFVQGGGCSGMQYGFTFDEDQNQDDFDFDHKGIKVLVDSMSMQYLNNATIDYREDLMGAAFAIDNPNAETTCGCGSSFGI
jgi:iron-sulfur cluster insertion protein